MWRNIRKTVGPLLLLVACPPFAIVLWYINTALDGSFAALWKLFNEQGMLTAIYHIWRPVMFGSLLAFKAIFAFAIFQLILMRVLPGKIFHGPLTPQGNVPVYKANGVLAFFTTLLVLSSLTLYWKLFPATLIYDNLGSILGALNIFSLLFCLFLYLKGRFAPSSTDNGVTGNFFFDYYWGTELYPYIAGWNLKMFITCRFGMMSWGILLISYAAKQQALYGLSDSMIVSVVLQLLYITKFYVWETGYWRSLDIMHDRAGFYICWGCMVWVPCVYTSPAMYLVLHPVHLGVALSAVIIVLGGLSIAINYLADNQRQIARATAGNCQIWGKKASVMHVTYQTLHGETKQSVLLTSGWWGISRHFHYLPEIAAAFFWSVPALFANFSPYFYVTFLSLLLLDRAFRDDKRCAKKYGQFWKKYCELVPYKIVPFVI
jgi:7-dehydrocholesterol reductase